MNYIPARASHGLKASINKEQSNKNEIRREIGVVADKLYTSAIPFDEEIRVVADKFYTSD